MVRATQEIGSFSVTLDSSGFLSIHFHFSVNLLAGNLQQSFLIMADQYVTNVANFKFLHYYDVPPSMNDAIFFEQTFVQKLFGNIHSLNTPREVLLTLLKPVLKKGVQIGRCNLSKQLN